MGKLRLKLIAPVPVGVDPELLRQTIGFINHSHDLNLPDGEINLKFTGDPEMRRLNKDFSGHDYATDVLSFSYIENDRDPIGGVLGELIISADTAKRQAESASLSLSEEVAVLTIHGVLHILGLDHQQAAEQARMEQLQAKYAQMAGIKYRNFWS